MTQTLIGLYDSYDTALQVALRLKDAGFMDRDVSPLASRITALTEATGPSAAYAGTGAAVGGVLGLAAGFMVGTGVGSAVAAGWLASTLAIGLAGAAAGGLTGGVVGALAGTGTERGPQISAESVRRGDTLVTVLASDDRALEAERILSSFPPEWHDSDGSGLPAGSEPVEPVLPSGLPRTPEA